jgi:hypothetical protein
VALEGVGRRLLRGIETATLLAKLTAYYHITDGFESSPHIILIRKRIGLRGLGIICQECIDLLR